MSEPFMLSDEFVGRYADVVPNWGFNGLGYITYKRTYARPVFDSDGETILRTEEWHETVQRVVNGAQAVGADLTEVEAKRLFDYIFFLKGCVAGRMLWQLGTDNNTRLGGDSLVNCLGGETKVLTLDGYVRIDKLSSIGTAVVLTAGPKWVEAEIRSFGVQPLGTVMLQRNSETKIIRATPNHRWIIKLDDGSTADVETIALTNGMQLKSTHDTSDNWTVVSVSAFTDREEVFCAVVPDTHTFTLEDDILTGNCWFVDVKETSDFAWAIERLMLGGGVGFSCDRPERLGVVRQGTVIHRDENDSDFIVPDKREGWGELIFRVFEAYLGAPATSSTLTYSTSLIRPAGTPIKTFGGTASGPDILVHGVKRICEVLDNAVGRCLTSVDVLDCMNIIGSIVVAGNVRRSAEIAVGSAHDTEYLMAKRWDLGNIPIERAMSNNSIFVSADEMKNLPDLVWEGYKGNGEPYGFINLEAARKFGRMGEERFDPTIVGVNPCAEIFLADRESCNLSEIFLPMIDSKAELIDLAVLLYKVQKAIAAMPYLDWASDQVTSANMRLGLGITGVAQALDKLDWLDDTYNALRVTDKAWSAAHGWPESVRLTTIKPSGTLSLLPGVTPGVHPGFSRFFVKRMRMAAHDPLVKYCMDKGFHVEPLRNFDGSVDDRTVVVSFPCAFPEHTIVAADMSAIEQLDLVRDLQRIWADNSISVTVYYRLSELDGIRAYLCEHWAEMKSVSFLLHNEHGFDQAPLGELSEGEYAQILAATKPLGERIVGSTYMSEEDMASFGESCDTGVCPVR